MKYPYTTVSGIDPKLALDLWKSSSGHNEVIIGYNDWSFITTMGVAMIKTTLMYGLEEMRIRQVIMTLKDMKSYIHKNKKTY